MKKAKITRASNGPQEKERLEEEMADHDVMQLVYKDLMKTQTRNLYRRLLNVSLNIKSH